MKKIKKILRFEDIMYTDMIGSLVVCHYIFLKDKMESVYKIKKRWNEYKRLTMNDKCPIDAEDIIGTTKKFFRLPDDEIPIAMVQSTFNTLFMPIDENGDIYPLREDGVYPNSYYHMLKAYKVDWSKK